MRAELFLVQPYGCNDGSRCFSSLHSPFFPPSHRACESICLVPTICESHAEASIIQESCPRDNSLYLLVETTHLPIFMSVAVAVSLIEMIFSCLPLTTSKGQLDHLSAELRATDLYRPVFILDIVDLLAHSNCPLLTSDWIFQSPTANQYHREVLNQANIAWQPNATLFNHSDAGNL